MYLAGPVTETDVGGSDSVAMSEQFFRRVCRYRYLLWLLFQFVVVLLLLSLFSVPFLEPGSPTYYISIINFVILLALLAASGGLAFVCERRRERKTVDAVDERDEA